MNLRRVLFVAAAASSATLGSELDKLTPVQQKLVKDALAAAVPASAKAEQEMTTLMKGVQFRASLAFEQAWDLLKMPAEELLGQLKADLACLEYTDNFGLDAMSRKMNPGREAMDLDTIEKFGHLPNDWELKLSHSSLIENVSSLQWAIYNAAETGLYSLPSFADPENPTADEVRNRSKYIGGNLRRIDTGLERYGAYTAVLRNDAVQKRAIFVPSDSGGWESLCNDSVTPINNHSRTWIHRFEVPCKPMFAGGEDRPVLGTMDHQLHTILGNTGVFGRVGGHFARMLHQLLTPGAKVRPIEVQMYNEALIFGDLVPSDFKVLVASFTGLFGTEDGEKLRAFCKRHSIPLAWGLGGGRTWPAEQLEKNLLTPWQNSILWEAGHARLLDPVAGFSATNATAPVEAAVAWEKAWAAAQAARATSTIGVEGPGEQNFRAWCSARQSDRRPPAASRRRLRLGQPLFRYDD